MRLRGKKTEGRGPKEEASRSKGMPERGFAVNWRGYKKSGRNLKAKEKKNGGKNGAIK